MEGEARSPSSSDDPTVQLMELFPDASADLCVQLVRSCGNDLELAVNMMLSGGDASAAPGSCPSGATGGTGKRRREHDSSSAVIDLSDSPEKHGKNQEELQLASARAAPSDRGGSSSSSRAGRDDGTQRGSWKVLSYNIWFEEDVEGFQRMRAIVKIIKEEDPDFVLLQEVTPLLLQALLSMGFSAGFRCSEPLLFAPYFTMILVAERVGPCTFSRRIFPQSQ